MHSHRITHLNTEGQNALPISEVHNHIKQLIQSGNTFKAYMIANEINKLNGYTIISKWQLRHWQKESNINTYQQQGQHEESNRINPYRELQKAYMKMLQN